jgi:hypothetical protein
MVPLELVKLSYDRWGDHNSNQRATDEPGKIDVVERSEVDEDVGVWEDEN